MICPTCNGTGEVSVVCTECNKGIPKGHFVYVNQKYGGKLICAQCARSKHEGGWEKR